ncbi:hypothetical protein GCM10009765_41140 [Fodinicola feengrottensis]|uniref:Uncharacterized protein n=1 Tax=Fodinicola feengrottensis TaxID=435914 RepID=A0ABN2HG08_9ACTN
MIALNTNRSPAWRKVSLALVALVLTLGTGLVQTTSASADTSLAHVRTTDKIEPSAAAAHAKANPDCVGQVVYEVHVQELGWQPSACDGGDAGSTGSGLRLEEIQMVVGWGNICLQGHVQNIGDQEWKCEDLSVRRRAEAGTTGQGLRLEGVHILTWGGPTLCAQAYLQNTGWQQAQCGAAIWVGTSGQGIRMEAFRAWRNT